MLDQTLADRLMDLRVRIDTPDEDTAVLWDVPTNERFFSKPRSNLLVKRPSQGLQYVVCVDEDLEYRGGDPVLMRLFASGEKKSGWRAIFLGDPSGGLDGVVSRALDALGFDGKDPMIHPAKAEAPVMEGGLMAVFGDELGRPEFEGADCTIGFEEEINETAAALLKWNQPSLALVVGPSGSGKTHLLRAVSRRLSACTPGYTIVSVDAGRMFAGTLFQSDRENLLSGILKEASDSPEIILAFERVDLIQSDTAYGLQLLAGALESGVRIAGTSATQQVPALLGSCLGRWLHLVRVVEMSAEQALAVLRTRSELIAEHYGIEIDESCLRSCVVAAADLAGCFPAKAIDLLVSAAARAHVAGSHVVGQDDVLVAAKHMVLAETMRRQR